MKNETTVEMCHPHQMKQICWSAIFIGAVVGVGLGFLLNLFGIAIGLSTFNANNTGTMVVAVGGLIGVIIGVIAAMLPAGFAAGYLGRCVCPRKNLGILYGFATWTIALLISAVVTAHVGNYVANYTSNLSPSIAVVSDSDKNASTEIVAVDETAPASQSSLKLTTSQSGLAWGALIIFGLFFIGAIAACVGAHWGMTCRCIE